MMIWLDPARPVLALALADGVLRGDEFACARDLHKIHTRAHEAASALEGAARERAQSILDGARLQAEALDRESAQRRAENETAGYEEGMRRALKQVHEALQAQMRAERNALRRAESRLTATVMRAAEKLVLETDRAALFERARTTLQRIIDTQSYVCLSVHPSDTAHATEALETACRIAGHSGGYEVLSDARLNPGDCRCEWDYGVLDFSLDVQLTAIRGAFAQAARDDAEKTMDERSVHSPDPAMDPQ